MTTSEPGTVTLSCDNEVIISVEDRLLRIFEEYCADAAKRRDNFHVSFTSYADLFTLAIQLGFAETPYKYLDPKWRRLLQDVLEIRGFVMQPLTNISILLDAISKQEASFGLTNWVFRFLTPFLHSQPVHEGGFEGRSRLRIRQKMFRKRMLDVREAVLCDDWPRVGTLIGCIETIRLDPTEYTRKQRWQLHRTVFSKVAPYSVSLFHAGVQRLMQHNIPCDVLAKSIVEFLLAMVNAEKCAETHTVRVRNLSLLYACDVLIFLIANGLERDANDLISAISSMPAIAQTNEFMLSIRSYKALHRYEQWRMNNSEQEPSEAVTLVDDLIEAVNELPQGECTVFMQAMVHLLSSLDLNATVVEVLTDCCTKCTFMLSHAYNALIKHQLQSEAQQLLSTVLSSCVDGIASDAVILEWVQPRLLNPQNFDVPSEMMIQICKRLFEFLDYGENRCNERAWALLWACVQFMPDKDVLRSHINSRIDWWPTFHSVQIHSAGYECRKNVLTLFAQPI